MKLYFIYLKLKNKIKFYLNKNISNKIFLGTNVQFFGLNNIMIKDNCTIGENSLFTVNNRISNDIQLTIGKNVYIGRSNFISVGKSIVIGDYSIFGNECSLICSDHIFDNPLIPYALSGNSFTKQISIGVNCWLGHGVTILGNVKIGHGCIIGANALIINDVAPFSMVVGNPAKVIKTFNFESNKWEKEIRECNSSYLNEKIYLNYLTENYPTTHLAYHSASSKLGHL